MADPDDPQVGLYLFDRYVGDEDAESAFMNFLAYDGESVILRWLSNRTLEPPCAYGSFRRPLPDALRMHARVTPDGEIFALQPCFGWVLVGRFVDGGRIESEYPFGPAYRLRRVTRRELDGPLGAELEEAGFFDCHEVYEAEGEPIPPLP